MPIAYVKTLPLHVEKVKLGFLDIRAPVRSYEHQLRFTIETEELVVPDILPYIGFGYDSRANPLICPFPVANPVAATAGLSQAAAGKFSVESPPVGAYESASAVVRALEHELLRQRVPVYVLRPLPYAERRDYMLFANQGRDIGFHRRLVHKRMVERIMVIEFLPLQLLAVALRRFQVRPSSHRLEVAVLHGDLVGKMRPPQLPRDKGTFSRGEREQKYRHRHGTPGRKTYRQHSPKARRETAVQRARERKRNGAHKEKRQSHRPEELPKRESRLGTDNKEPQRQDDEIYDYEKYKSPNWTLKDTKIEEEDVKIEQKSKFVL